MTPLLQLVHTVNQIEGRKKLQKMVHILKELGAPFGEPFEYSYYGMYSLQLKNEVSQLETEGLVCEEPQVGWGGHSTFTIKATPTLEGLINEFELNEPPAWAERARELNQMSPQKLEGVSTVLFLRQTERDSSTVRSRLLSLKPHLADLADDCLATVSHLTKAA